MAFAYLSREGSGSQEQAVLKKRINYPVERPHVNENRFQNNLRREIDIGGLIIPPAIQSRAQHPAGV